VIAAMSAFAVRNAVARASEPKPIFSANS